MRQNAISIILVITCSILLIQSTQTGNNILQSYESLIIYDNYYKLYFSYQDHSAKLPDSLISLFNKSSISQLTLLMGVINPSSLTQKHLILPIYHGISILIKNSSQITVQNFKSIAQAFSISRSQEFITYIQQSELTFISNPNDKFCSQHLKTIIDLFLPCGNNAGIGSIINEKSFFIDKMFLGIKLHWKINQKVQLSFIVDKKTQQVKNYLKLSEQKRQSRRCMHFGKLLVQNTIKKQDNDVLKYNDQSQKILFTKSIRATFPSNYYSDEKSMFLQIDLNNFLSQIDDNLRYNSLTTTEQGDQYQNQKLIINQQPPFETFPMNLTLRFALPQGFEMKEITSTCQKCQNIIDDFNISKNQPQKHNYKTLYKITVQLTNTLNHNNKSSFIKLNPNSLLTFQFHYQAHLKTFQNYQNIAGGGQQFMNIPQTIQTSNKQIILIVSNQLRNMFDRLLQPDFSIPFKTVTFTLAIIGYLFISVWKALFAQLQYQKNNHKTLEEIEQIQTKQSSTENISKIKQNQLTQIESPPISLKQQ